TCPAVSIRRAPPAVTERAGTNGFFVEGGPTGSLSDVPPVSPSGGSASKTTRIGRPGDSVWAGAPAYGSSFGKLAPQRAPNPSWLAFHPDRPTAGEQSRRDVVSRPGRSRDPGAVAVRPGDPRMSRVSLPNQDGRLGILSAVGAGR